jgi:hypothetical protein
MRLTVNVVASQDLGDCPGRLEFAWKEAYDPEQAINKKETENTPDALTADGVCVNQIFPSESKDNPVVTTLADTAVCAEITEMKERNIKIFDNICVNIFSGHAFWNTTLKSA